MAYARDDDGRRHAPAWTEPPDSRGGESFDRFTRLAMRLLGVPVALVSLGDAELQYYPSAVGLQVRETSLSRALCRHVVRNSVPLVVSDARQEPHLGATPVTIDLGVIAYAGMPVTDGAGETVGSLCVIDREPRSWSESELAILADLAAAVSAEVRVRAMARSLQGDWPPSRPHGHDAGDATTSLDADADAGSGSGSGRALAELPDHEMFWERLVLEITRARRHRRPLSVAVINLDRFDAINQRLGRAAGDRVLVEAALRLSALVKDGQTLAWVGADTFAWILPAATETAAASALRRLIRAFASAPFAGVGTVTISAGVAELGENVDTDGLYAQAADALEHAKRAGRDRVCRYFNRPALQRRHAGGLGAAH
jgi:diguanylate cyclase (GGDEF)-like protein